MLLCYLNVKQNVRVMAECECTIKMELLLTREHACKRKYFLEGKKAVVIRILTINYID